MNSIHFLLVKGMYIRYNYVRGGTTMDDSNIIEKSILLYNEGFDNCIRTYVCMNDIMETILKDYYGDINKVRFPIDIRGIIAKRGIDIVEMNLNTDLGFQINRVNGYLRKLDSDGDCKWRIYIEYSDSEFTKRYILAHEFSHYILKMSEETQLDQIEYCIDPMLSKKKCEMLADVMVAFLMFPYRQLLETMKAHTDQMKIENTYPIDSVQFIRSLGNSAQISSYYTFMCFQYVRFYLCYLYNQNDQPNSEIKKLLITYEDLFR